MVADQPVAADGGALAAAPMMGFEQSPGTSGTSLAPTLSMPFVTQGRWRSCFSASRPRLSGIQPDDSCDVPSVLNTVGQHHVGPVAPGDQDLVAADGAGTRSPQTRLPRRERGR
jgi:hypothetical protein